MGKKLSMREADRQLARGRNDKRAAAAWPLVSVDEKMGLVIVTDRETPDADHQTMWGARLSGELLVVERQKKHRFLDGQYQRERRWMGETLTMAPVMPDRVKAKIEETMKAGRKK